ncbi:hypothetical protein [Acinetobacter johnsonii]|jgi:hypothetical protein|uniref:hypothetical protein n=1 Tax=Acinetobacter johnsonii TaxID=40214 RepID=UPI00294AAC91|nr:hypothetical protein [Acinetobacter johnsonii]
MSRLIKKAAYQAVLQQEEGLKTLDEIFKTLDPARPQDRISIEQARDLISKAGEQFKDSMDWMAGIFEE